MADNDHICPITKKSCICIAIGVCHEDSPEPTYKYCSSSDLHFNSNTKVCPCPDNNKPFQTYFDKVWNIFKNSNKSKDAFFKALRSVYTNNE